MSEAPPPYAPPQGEKGGYPEPGPGYPPQPTPGYPQPSPGYPQPSQGYPQQPQPQPGVGGYPQQPPPAQGGYPQAPPPAGTPGAQSSQTVVVTAQPTVIVGAHFGPGPVQTVCPHCRAQIVTACDYEVGMLAWLICVGLCIVGCDLGCCFIPFCVDGCKDVIHKCPNCQQYLGTYKRGRY